MQIKLCLLPLITLEQKIYAISLNPDKLEMLNINLSKIKEVVNIRSLISELYGKYIELDVNWHFPVLIDNSIVEENKEVFFMSIYSCHLPHSVNVINGAHILEIDSDIVETSQILKKSLCL